jgi:CRISPR-associated exonuclease Cas4
MSILFWLALFLLVLSVVLLWIAARQRKSSGLPQGRVIYTDTRAWNRLEKPLYDPLTALTGKPDYLVEQNDRIIPVEIKSGWAPAEPHPSHIFQLAAYCLLVEKAMGKRPEYGIIQYRNRAFSIDFTQTLEEELLNLLDEMRRDEKQACFDRSHDEYQRCASCGFNQICDQHV